jgi:histidinol-phosphate/aromatic aminotransferase/cobyric acid decarboxylase-like protein
METAVEYTSANDWSSSRAASIANPNAPTGSAMNAPKMLPGLPCATVTRASRPIT